MKILNFLDFPGFEGFLIFLWPFWGPGGIPMDSQRNFDPTRGPETPGTIS